MPNFPAGHITDSLELSADAKIDLFELTPLAGGTVYFKGDNPVEWRGRLYEGLPCGISGEEESLDKSPTPKMVIGQEDLDMLPLKALVHDGHIDGATLVRKRLLLDDLLNNRNIQQTTWFRVKRVSDYTRTKITLVLASFSSAAAQTVPFRQYVPPAFPWVEL